MVEVVNDLGATAEEDAKIKAEQCGSCDFGSGRRGMDRCSRCDGTGSVLVFDGARYENSREGYAKALAAVRQKASVAPVDRPCKSGQMCAVLCPECVADHSLSGPSNSAFGRALIAYRDAVRALPKTHPVQADLNGWQPSHVIGLAAALGAATRPGKFRLGDRVEKVSGASWRGKVVGWYSTTLTPEGYAVESEREPGSVQIYPAAALCAVPSAQ